jgi:electron transport complex protein RnfG
MLVGVSNGGKVTGLVVTDLSETCGLGAEALSEHPFLAQFLNTSGNVAIGTAGADAFSGATDTTETSEDSLYVDAMSGATVTSKAVARCVNSAVAFVTGADVESGATSWGG